MEVTQSQLNEFLKNLDQAIKTKNWPYVKQILEYVNFYGKSLFNKYLRVTLIRIERVVPLVSFTEVVEFGLNLNEMLKNENFSSLAHCFKRVHCSRVNSTSVKCFHLRIHLERKNKLLYCYGPDCFKYGKEYNKQSLLTLICCKFHSFCKPCLYKHITLKLGNPYNKEIMCPACEITGAANKKYIIKKEINELIPDDIYNSYFMSSANRQLLGQCKSNYSSCPYKNTYLQKEYLLVFNCGESICTACYSMYLEEVIFDTASKIQNNPVELANCLGFGFTCHLGHTACFGLITLDDVRKLLPLSLSQSNKKDNVKVLLEENYEYFSGFTMVCCQKCRILTVKTDSNLEECTKCGNCLNCFEPSHPGIDCTTFRNIKATFVRMGQLEQPVQNSTDPNYRNYIRAVEILGVLKLTNLKIDNFCNITPSGLQEYKNKNLKEMFPNMRHKILLSFPFSNMSDLSNFLYEEFVVDPVSKFIKFPQKFGILRDCPAFIVFKVDYMGDIVSRMATAKDRKEEPSMYSDQEFFYISHADAIIPFMAIITSQCS